MPYLDTIVSNDDLKKRINNISKKCLDDETCTSVRLTKHIMNTFLNLDGNKQLRYAPFYILKDIEKVSKENPEKNILLFLDELNRTSHDVHQEIMNLILNRNINGYNLPDNVFIMCAMNPSSKYSDFQNTDYQVTELDPAQEDRFLWINIEADIKTWLQWANNKSNLLINRLTSNKRNIECSLIHPDIQEYLAENPENLIISRNDCQDDVFPTPRSWERVSKAYTAFKNNHPDEDIDDFTFNLFAGNIGKSLATDLLTQLKKKRNPLPTMEFLFNAKTLINNEEKDELNQKIVDKIKNEQPLRLIILSNRIINYLEKEKKNSNYKKFLLTFSKILTEYPFDIINGIYDNLQNNHKKLFNDLCENSQKFISNYLELERQVHHLIND